MRGTGENRIEIRPEPVFSGRIRIQDFQPVSGLAPDLDIRRVQSELARQFGPCQSWRLCKRVEQAQMHPQVDEMDRIETAPPFQNPPDLRIHSALTARF